MLPWPRVAVWSPRLRHSGMYPCSVRLHNNSLFGSMHLPFTAKQPFRPPRYVAFNSRLIRRLRYVGLIHAWYRCPQLPFSLPHSR